MKGEPALGPELAYYLGDLESRELVAWQCGDWAVLHQLIRQGVPVHNAARMRTRVRASVFDRCVMPRTTPQSKAASAMLTAGQSERAVRVAHIYALATRVFGDRNRGRVWLQTPSSALDGHTPGRSTHRRTRGSPHRATPRSA